VQVGGNLMSAGGSDAKTFDLRVFKVLVRRAHKDNEAIDEGNGPAGPNPKKHSVVHCHL
jgi:hypothetical protein